ncbi:hypothetical protein [Massilia eurypsychrophila]|uniref:hypothetical protein n=1 Tax=Massilia eurypsychrophila TaxID=1485217 RepID=UPI00103514EB|nr:hypothetical protein [Massilia eurypsychrophila]
MKTEVMALGEKTRFMVTSLSGLDAGMLYGKIFARAFKPKTISNISRTIWPPSVVYLEVEPGLPGVLRLPIESRWS